MDIAKIIEAFVGVGGVFLAITYVIGGLIVNLHLSRYGIVEYQILRVKYLVVGLVYLTNFIAVLFLAMIPAIFVAGASFTVQQILLILSLLSSVLLIWLWGKTDDKGKKSLLFSWRFWVLMGTVSSIYPLMAAIKLALTVQITFETIVTITQVLLAGVLSFVGQTYFYARHLYGRRNTIFGSVDPVGMGIPVQVQLAGDSEQILMLDKLGFPLLSKEVTDRVLLLDETDEHYIIGVLQDDKIRAAKVSKDMVKAILFS